MNRKKQLENLRNELENKTGMTMRDILRASVRQVLIAVATLSVDEKLNCGREIMAELDKTAKEHYDPWEIADREFMLRVVKYLADVAAADEINEKVALLNKLLDAINSANSEPETPEAPEDETPVMAFNRREQKPS